jgi:hypothetical protein
LLDWKHDTQAAQNGAAAADAAAACCSAGNLNTNGQELLVYGRHFGNIFIGVQVRPLPEVQGLDVFFILRVFRCCLSWTAWMHGSPSSTETQQIASRQAGSALHDA